MRKLTTNIFILLLMLFLQHGCGKKPKVDFDNIVAIIAGDTLFISEFLTRAEYNVRPTYCDNKRDYDKHIILNSIIAEKLFALESTNTRSLVDNERFNARIKGIKEQIMREELLYDEINSKIVVPQDEIRQYYINSKKIVDAVAIFIPNSIDANAVYKDAQNGMNFKQLSEKYIGISKPIEKKITWETVDEGAQLAIFSDNVTQGTIIEPIESEGGKRLIKVIGWTEEIELSPGTVDKQMELIKGKLHNRYVAEVTNKYVANIMKGKELKFDPKSWEVISTFLKPLYVSSDENEEIELRLSEIDTKLKNNADDLFILDGDKR